MIINNREIIITKEVSCQFYIGMTEPYTGSIINETTEQELYDFFNELHSGNPSLIPPNFYDYTEAQLYDYKIDKFISLTDKYSYTFLDGYIFEQLKELASFLSINFNGIHILNVNGNYLYLSNMTYYFFDDIQSMIINNPNQSYHILDFNLLYYKGSLGVTFYIDISSFLEYLGVYEDLKVAIPNYLTNDYDSFPYEFRNKFEDFIAVGNQSPNFMTMYTNYPIFSNIYNFKGFLFNTSYLMEYKFNPQITGYFDNFSRIDEFGSVSLINRFNPYEYFIVLPIEKRIDLILSYNHDGSINGGASRAGDDFPTKFKVFKIHLSRFHDKFYDPLNDGGTDTNLKKCCLAECFGITE